VLDEMLNFNRPHVGGDDFFLEPYLAEQVLPDAFTFGIILELYARLTPPNSWLPLHATERCRQIFDDMESKWNVTRNAFSYYALQTIYARANQPEAAELLLLEMTDLYEQTKDPGLHPSLPNYNAVLNSYSRRASLQCTQKACEMLEKMERPANDGGYDVDPDRLSYALTILTCSRCQDELLGAELAEKVLTKMEERAAFEARRREEASGMSPPSVTLDIECFNAAVSVIARCRSEDSIERASRIVSRMEQYAANGQPKLKPNLRTYSGLLNAYQKSDDDRAAEEAERIVRNMEVRYAAGDLDSPPDVYHYTILLGAWAKSKRRHATQRSLQILSYMVDRAQSGYKQVNPNVRTFNAVLDCLSRAGEVDTAEQLLFHMLHLFQKGDKAAAPDTFSFNCVIRSHCSPSAPRGSGRRAELILDRLLEYSAEENPQVLPDTKSFSHLISFYSKSRELDAPYRAEYILRKQMELFETTKNTDLLPAEYSIGSVIESFSRVRHPHAGRIADRLLVLVKRLRKEYGVRRLNANTSLMNRVLHAWATCEDPQAGEEAEKHLVEMEQAARGTPSALSLAPPNTNSYRFVLTAWTKSTAPDKAERALAVFRRMLDQEKDHFVVPDEHAYSLVINACAFTRGGVVVETEALRIAGNILREMHESPHVEPTSLAYGWFLQACGRLRVPDEIRIPAIVDAFQRCCKDGRVNEFVFLRLKCAAPYQVFQELMAPVVTAPGDVAKSGLDVRDLPAEWTRNGGNTSKHPNPHARNNTRNRSRYRESTLDSGGY
jgi:pentatricopeptide repeat protein